MEALTWNRQYTNNNMESSIHNQQLESLNTEMANWKRQYGTLHKITGKFHVIYIDLARTYLNFILHISAGAWHLKRKSVKL